MTSTFLETKALVAVGKYLEDRGWTVLVISADRIQGPVDRVNYEVVFRFTGTPPSESLASAPYGRPRDAPPSEPKPEGRPEVKHPDSGGAQ